MSGSDAPISGDPTRLLYRTETRAMLEGIGAIMPIILFLAPMTAIKEVVQAKTVGVLPSLPFIAMFLNCFLWTLFGVKLLEKAMIFPNAFGLVLSCYYVKTYCEYTNQPMKKPLLITTFLTCIGFIAFIQEDAQHIGNMAAIASISMLSAPLAQASEVIKTGNTAILGTVPMSFVGFCTALTWTIIGFVYLNNPQVYICNFLGFLGSSATLALFAIFGARRKHDTYSKVRSD